MRGTREFALVALALFAAVGAKASSRELADALDARARVVRSSRGFVADASRLSLGLSSDRGNAVRRLVESGAGVLYPAGERVDLEVAAIRESLSGTHVELKQTIGGLEVIGGGFVATINPGGVLERFHNRIAIADRTVVAYADRDWLTELMRRAPDIAGRPILENRPVYVNDSGLARLARRVVVAVSEYETYAYYLDGSTGELLWREPLFYTASTRVFDSNPVTRLNDPALRDQNDSAAAVPEAAYSIVSLDDVPGAGTLRGPDVEIVDVEAPTTLRADLAKSLVFDREADEFEEVMAYFQIDRSQKYIRSLGFTGARAVIDHPLKVDAHAVSGADNSFYRVAFGEGMLFFGDGGVDDAEDPDILLHEFGHAIHEGIAPGAFAGSNASESRAMGEGFGDYWAFSEGYSASRASGRDPYCVGDWDARCGGGNSERCGYPAGADCLRRVDGTKTMADFIQSNQAGTEHRNGQIWSSALREVFEGLVEGSAPGTGKRVADTIVLESIFGLSPTATFSMVAQQMLDADEALFQGSNRGRICIAMVFRGILEPDLCGESPRGEFVLFQGFDAGIGFGPASPLVLTTRVEETRPISDARVRVNIRHPRRGDLRLLLESPEGVRITLKVESTDDAADLDVTFGLDARPAESLAGVLGKPGNGDWKLTLIDSGSSEGGEVISWELLLAFRDLGPITSRGYSSLPSRVIPAVARAEGAEETHFVSDVRLFNSTGEHRMLEAFFTPMGANGFEQYAAIRISLAPGQSIALDDVVSRQFRTSGLGSLEFRGNVDGIEITSRTYNDNEAGTYGQFIPSVDSGESLARGTGSLHIPQMQNTSRFRTNIGISETSGASGLVEVRLFDGEGLQIQLFEIPIEPFGLHQFSILGGPSGALWHRVRATVTVIEGDARVVAYGSVVDNQTGDPIYIPGRRLPTLPEPVRIPAVAHTSGGFETEWRSDVWLANVTATARLVSVIYYPTDGSTPMLFDQFVGAGQMVAIPDILFTRYAATKGLGQLEVIPGGVVVTSRTWTVKGEGGYGQFIPGVYASDAIGSGDGVMRAIGVANSNDYRTNIGIAETSGALATARIRLRDSSGAEIVDIPVTVAPNSLFQVGLQLIGAPVLTNGVVEFEVIGGTGRIVAYASIVDNHSGDPTFVPAR